MTTAAPRLFWAMRPAHMTCAGPGCGRAPLCGFLSADGETFFCAACVEIDEHQQRFRTPEERERILRGNP